MQAVEARKPWKKGCTMTHEASLAFANSKPAFLLRLREHLFQVVPIWFVSMAAGVFAKKVCKK